MTTATLHFGPKRDNPVPAVVISVAFHLGLVACIWFFSRDAGPRIDLSKPIQAHLVRQGEERDQKLLPRMENNTPPPEPEAVPIPAKPTPSEPLEAKKPPPKPAPKKDVTKDLFAA